MHVACGRCSGSTVGGSGSAGAAGGATVGSRVGFYSSISSFVDDRLISVCMSASTVAAAAGVTVGEVSSGGTGCCSCL